MYDIVNIISVFFVISGIGVAIHIGFDLSKNKQSMKIMNAVWILSGLWGSYLALWAYTKFGREHAGNDSMKGMDMGNMDMKGMKMDNMDMSGMDMKGMDMSGMKMDGMNMSGMNMGPKRPHWQSIALSALHCGAGCTLADIIGEWITAAIPMSLFGSTIAADWVFDFFLALIIGVYFQFYAIREMEKISVGKGLLRAFKADFFSLTAWQIGMYGWMAIVYFVLFKDFPHEKNAWTFWFMMQIAMLCGFICGFPMNALLIKLGVKKGM